MTIVAAVARDGVVTMAADTATNYQGTPLVGGARKILRLPIETVEDQPNREVLIAASGDAAMLPVAAQLELRYPDLPADPSDIDEVTRWAHGVARQLTKRLASQTPEMLRDAHDGGKAIDGAFLLGWAGHLFYLFTNQAHRPPDGVAALGSGCDVAFGALHAALEHGDDPVKACERAVLLACRYAEGCAVDDTGPLLQQLKGI